MKKATIVLTAIGLGLVCSLAVYAGAEKNPLVPTSDLATAEDGIHANANGFAVVNMTPDGAIGATIEIQLRDGAPKYTYVVKSGGNVIGTLTTNKVGNGGCHVNVADLEEEDEGLGNFVNIWTADGVTRLLRAPIP
ncbi:MAG: hypothetical protein JW955_05355 [Sedimentisphaerales bacterium]|nr:hypothetical protein [Sedimentisphaerales bacterium]